MKQAIFTKSNKTMILTKPPRNAAKAPTNTQPVMVVTPKPMVPFNKVRFTA